MSPFVILIAILVVLFVIYWLWNRFRPPTGITQFQDKVVVITGASSGIGKATAQKFAQLGANLVLVARRQDQLDELKHRIEQSGKSQVLVVPADLTQIDDLTGVIARIKEAFGHIDILINNAGIVDTEPLEAISDQRIDQIIAINLIAPINLVRLALPLLLSQPKTHIVNVSSTVALSLVPRQATYGASKAGLNGFSDAMRRELRGTGVGISIVMPGLVNTPMLGDFQTRDDALNMLKESGMGVPGVYLNEAPEIADHILDAIRYNRRAVILGGWLFGLLSWMGQHTPLWLDGVYAQMFKADDLQRNVRGGT